MKLFDLKWRLNLKITFESNISGLFPPHWGSVELGQSLCFDVEINLNTCAAIGSHQMRWIIQIFFLSLIKKQLRFQLGAKNKLDLWNFKCFQSCFETCYWINGSLYFTRDVCSLFWIMEVKIWIESWYLSVNLNNESFTPISFFLEEFQEFALPKHFSVQGFCISL